ncbi:MAG: cob(I)yrinic acid a,c-diamide adenosyltransferase [bacterium]|nr:cob(I)yrinic acid a,c-diamide adenosyltransferase [bacterium]
MPRKCVQIYTGDGKGKTTAALGLAMRALGRGWRVLLIQFLKPPGGSGETGACLRLPGFESMQFGGRAFVRSEPPDPADRERAERGLQAAEQRMGEGWDMIILDEILQAVSLGLIGEENVLGLMRNRPDSVELVLTGRGATEALIAEADLVTEMVAVKHPYAKGMPARPGIEY